MQMILDGPNIKDQSASDDSTTQAALSLSQLLVFNCNKRKRDLSTIRHEPKRETPLPVYLGLTIYAQTQKRGIIDGLYSLGLCSSYSRIRQVTTAMANSVCSQFETENIVCPPQLYTDLFTTGAVDNIDHNTSSRNAKDSFHGTAISLTQHPTTETAGIKRNAPVIDERMLAEAVMSDLPAKYANVPQAVLIKKDHYAPIAVVPLKPDSSELSVAQVTENSWLESGENSLDKDELDPTENISWAAFHANLQHVFKTVQPQR